MLVSWSFLKKFTVCMNGVCVEIGVATYVAQKRPPSRAGRTGRLGYTQEM